MKKRCLVLFVFFMMVIGMNGVHSATKDTNPPVLESIRVINQKEYYMPGEKVYLEIIANDDVSGIAYGGVVLNGGGGFGSSAEIFDINSNPYIVIPESYIKGNYLLEQISISDNSNNNSCYHVDGGSFFCKKLDTNIILRVETFTNDIIDNTIPELESIIFDKEEYTLGDKIKATIKTKDNNSIKEMRLCLRMVGENQCFSNDDITQNNYDSNQDAFIYYLNCPGANGEYVIDSFDLTSSSNKKNAYYFYNPNYSYPELKMPSFRVVNVDNIIQALGLIDVKYEYKEVYAPSIFKFGLKIRDDKNIVQSLFVIIGKKNSDNFKQLELVLDKDGYYSTILDIDEYTDIGDYYIKQYYYNLKDEYRDLSKQFNNKYFSYDQRLFTIVEDNFYDIITSTVDKNLINKIKEADNDAKIGINCSNDPWVKKEVFEAIMGTNKEIYLETNGIIWKFDGKSIKNPKDINVTTSFDYYYSHEYSDILDNYIDNGIVINFYENDLLPGPAEIKLKMDYVFRDYLGLDGLSLYYFDNSSSDDEMFSYLSNDIFMDEDGYYVIRINHNSSYILTRNVIDEKYVKDDSEIIKDLEEVNGDKETLEDKVVVKGKKSSLLLVVLLTVVVLVIVGITIFMIFKYKVKKKK